MLLKKLGNHCKGLLVLLLATSTYLYAEDNLIKAAKSGQVGVVKQLIESGTDVNQTNTFGSTALLQAAEYGKTEIVEMLLNAGADALYSGQKEFVIGMDKAKFQLEQVKGSFDTEEKPAPKSFVSEKNKVDSVQFIMRTPEIRIPKAEKEALAPIPKKGFFEKLKGLFD